MSVALLIISMVALAGLGTLLSSLRAVGASTVSTRGTQLANEALEELETLPWNSFGFYAADPRDTGTPRGYVASFEGYPTATLPAASVLDPRVPLPVRTITRQRTTFTVRTHIVTLPEGTDSRAFRRVSVLLAWSAPDGRALTTRADRIRSSTSGEKGLEAFQLRSVQAVTRDSAGIEKSDPFRLTVSGTAAPGGTRVVVRASTNRSAGAVVLRYPAVDATTNATVQRDAPMSILNSDDRTWTVELPATEQFRSGTAKMTVTATSAVSSTQQATLDVYVDFVDPGERARRRVSVGSDFACWADVAGRVWCWGDGSVGQLGNGSTSGSTVPVRVGVGVTGFVDVQTVSAGHQHACAATKTGDLFCWGNTGSGRLGASGSNGNCGSTSCQWTPLKVALSDVRMVSTGGSHTCAVTGSRALHCWGDGSNGKVGTGSANNQSTPRLVNVTGAVSVAAGSEHTCAVDVQTQVWCWGDGTSNKLNGLGSTSTPALTSVTGATTITAPRGSTAAEAHTCIVSTAGAVGCWGPNGVGQAGGAASTSTTLRWVAGVANAVQVSAGARHTCATLHDELTAVRSESCWGSNEKGAFGNGTLVGGGPSAVSTAAGMAPPTGNGAGGLTSCATGSDDSVWCRGSNLRGALGNGTTTDSLTPVRVSGT